MAPITPFLTERVWQDLVRSVDADAAESVHLSGWPAGPAADAPVAGEELSVQVALARRLVELGRAARADAKVRTRQPLRRALIGSAAWAALSEELRAEVADELNVGALEAFSAAGGPGAELVEFGAKGNFRALGRRFAQRTPAVAAAIAAADAAQLATSLAGTGSAAVSVDGETVELLAEEVIVSERPKQGWSVANDQGETIALDLEMTPVLVRAGLAREVVRLVQEARKNAGLDVSDRIALTWSAGGQTAEALRENGAMVAEEVLAVQMTEGDPGAAGVRNDGLDLAFSLTASR